MSDYKPIHCDEHERLEMAVLQKQWLELKVKDGSQPGLQRLLPTDVQTRDGAEWLEAKTESGEHLTLRLDRLGLQDAPEEPEG